MGVTCCKTRPTDSATLAKDGPRISCADRKTTNVANGILLTLSALVLAAGIIGFAKSGLLSKIADGSQKNALWLTVAGGVGTVAFLTTTLVACAGANKTVTVKEQ